MCNVPDNILALLQKDVAEIKVALLGNEYNPQGGLLYRTADLECKLEKLQTRYEKMMWTAGGAGAAVSFIIGMLMVILDHLIS